MRPVSFLTTIRAPKFRCSFFSYHQIIASSPQKNVFLIMVLKSGIEDTIIEALIPFKVEKIILFGSYIYGVPDNESDIDILVIKSVTEDETRKTRLMLKKELWEKLVMYNIPFDLLVDDPERINKRIEMGDYFYKEILNKGKTIYA